MMSLCRRSALLACLLALVAAGARAELASFAKSSLTIDTVSGPQHFTIELARSPEQQQQGLMFRRSLAADGHVADIHERPVPLSEATIESKVPVRAVLELNGGSVARLGIHRGDLVHHAIFGTAAGS